MMSRAQRSATGGRSPLALCDLPEHTLLTILIAATVHHDLVRHVSIVSRVCRQWWRVAQGSVAYGTGYPADGAGEAERWRFLRGLSKRLQAARATRRLDLEGSRMGEEGAKVLAAALLAMASPSQPLAAHSPRLVGLWLQVSNLTAAGVSAIADAMVPRGAASALQHLALDKNPDVGDKGVAALAAVLPSTLEGLYLIEVGCGTQGMVALSAALPTLTRLARLDLCDNPGVGAEGWRAFGPAFGQLTALVDLYANLNPGMGSAGAAALAANLSGATSLRELHLSSNEIGDAGATALVAALPRSLLTDLNLAGNRFGAASTTALEEATAHIPDASLGPVGLKEMQELIANGEQIDGWPPGMQANGAPASP